MRGARLAGCATLGTALSFHAAACGPEEPKIRDRPAHLDPRTGLQWKQGASGWLGETEVTVAAYRRCVEAGACSDDKLTGIEWKEQPWTASAACNWAAPGREGHPLNCVDWIQADTYCRWAGGRLQTKNEWHDEATAGGRRRYPWGEEEPDCSRAVFLDWEVRGGPAGPKGCGRGGTAPPCSAAAGRSVHGLCDVVGNVWEWTDTKEFEGPETEPRYNLGGSWAASSPHLDTDFTLVNPVRFRIDTLGLRCAAPPGTFD